MANGERPAPLDRPGGPALNHPIAPEGLKWRNARHVFHSDVGNMEENQLNRLIMLDNFYRSKNNHKRLFKE